MKTRLLILVAGVALAIAVVIALSSRSASLVTSANFERLALDIHDYDLFDLGVAQVDDDELLDVFTANHSAAQSLLVNAGNGEFTDALSRFGLDQDHRFPGLEDSLDQPAVASGPGLYIYRYDRWLFIRAHGIDATQAVHGGIDLPWPVVVREAPPGTQVDLTSGAAGEIVSTVNFVLSGDQSLQLNGAEDIVEVPHRVVFAPGTDLARIFVGRYLTNPRSREFTMHWRDRHGMAWADYDGDGLTDVFVARGGIKGQLDNFAEPVDDELFAAAGGVFNDRTRDAGLQKGNCPARQVAWVDYDGDGDLDLYVSCGRGADPSFPNLMYRQDEGHLFAEVAASLGLAYGSASVFAWLDADNDNDLDLLSVEGGRLVLYRNDGGRFEPHTVAADLSGSHPYKLAVADYDNDGDLDVFAVHGRRSFLVQNKNGTLALEDPRGIGLPATGRTANWVDFDNDGLTDLHVVPGGLYRQDAEHRFHETGILGYSGQTDRIVDARSSWFDLDNDGDRDVIVAALSGPTLAQRFMRKFAGRIPDLGDHWQTATLVASAAGGNHWLQVDLTGPAGNRQAIGARVYVSTGGATQMAPVGSAEGSHFGQGHYRLYFGLAAASRADEIRVVWPDGTTRQLHDVPADQRLAIDYDGDR